MVDLRSLLAIAEAVSEESRCLNSLQCASARRVTPSSLDDSVRDDDNRGREQSFTAEEAEVEGIVDEACPDCPDCAGTRLNPSSRAVSFDAKSIA